MFSTTDFCDTTPRRGDAWLSPLLRRLCVLLLKERSAYTKRARGSISKGLSNVVVVSEKEPHRFETETTTRETTKNTRSRREGERVDGAYSKRLLLIMKGQGKKCFTIAHWEKTSKKNARSKHTTLALTRRRPRDDHLVAFFRRRQGDAVFLQLGHRGGTRASFFCFNPRAFVSRFQFVSRSRFVIDCVCRHHRIFSSLHREDHHQKRERPFDIALGDFEQRARRVIPPRLTLSHSKTTS